MHIIRQTLFIRKKSLWAFKHKRFYGKEKCTVANNGAMRLPVLGKKRVLVIISVYPYVMDDLLLVMIVFRVIILTTAISASVVAKNHYGD